MTTDKGDGETTFDLTLKKLLLGFMNVDTLSVNLPSGGSVMGGLRQYM